MVLESLIKPKKAEHKPYKMLPIGILYATVAIFISLWVFKEQASLVMVFITVICTTPLMYNIIKLEEKKDTKLLKERTLLREHSKVLAAFTFLFFGFIIAFSLWCIILPQPAVNSLFSTQTATINSINSKVTGQAIQTFSVPSTRQITTQFSSANLFSQIVSNNFKVMLFCIFFSFFFGAGAIFILTWNASVISAAIGTFIRNNLSSAAASTGLTQVATYFHVTSLGILKYSIHGVPEILAYFVGGLAGGIISVAVIRHDFDTKIFKHIIKDFAYLFALAIILVLIAAFLEVYVTPVIF